MKLFAIYIGGEHPKANIEVHDVRFAVAASITDTYDKLRAEWWGKAGSLHIDCWTEISHVEGFVVTLEPVPSSVPERLYFVNLGGYDGLEFAEQHLNRFVVATSTAKAKAKAMSATKGWNDAHRDDLYEADHVFALDAMIGERLFIHLTPTGEHCPPNFTCRYTPLT